MKKTTLIAFLICVCSFIHIHASTCSFAFEQSTGDGVSAWETYNSISNNYVIQAVILDGKTGTWGDPQIISNRKTSSYKPQTAINRTGAIAIIWHENDQICGKLRLCGTTYNLKKNHWNPFVYLSEKEETIDIQNYFVRISDHNQLSVVFSSFYPNSQEQLRAIYCPKYETWEASFPIAQ